MIRPSYESDIQAALKDLKKKRYAHISQAADAHDVDPRTLGRRLHDNHSRQDAQVNNRLLTIKEKENLVQWIEELNSRNYIHVL